MQGVCAKHAHILTEDRKLLLSNPDRVVPEVLKVMRSEPPAGTACVLRRLAGAKAQSPPAQTYGWRVHMYICVHYFMQATLEIGWWLDKADFYDTEWFPGTTSMRTHGRSICLELVPSDERSQHVSIPDCLLLFAQESGTLTHGTN